VQEDATARNSQFDGSELTKSLGFFSTAVSAYSLFAAILSERVERSFLSGIIAIIGVAPSQHKHQFDMLPVEPRLPSLTTTTDQ
jgi:hypothetical protein